MENSSDSRVYSIADIAHRWRCDTETVRKLIATGELDHFRIGRHIRVTQLALDAYEQGDKEQET